MLSWQAVALASGGIACGSLGLISWFAAERNGAGMTATRGVGILSGSLCFCIAALTLGWGILDLAGLRGVEWAWGLSFTSSLLYFIGAVCMFKRPGPDLLDNGGVGAIGGEMLACIAWVVLVVLRHWAQMRVKLFFVFMTLAGIAEGFMCFSSAMMYYLEDVGGSFAA